MSTNNNKSFNTKAPWGSYAPTGLAALAIRGCQSLPASSRLFYTLNKGLRGPIKSSEPRFFDVNSLGMRLRLLTRGNYCETTALFAPQFYDVAEFAWLRNGLADNSVFIDVGGNVGLYSLVAALNNASTRVIAVEPNETLTERLRFNAANNNLSVEVCETALSDYSGSGILDTSAKQSGQNQLSATANQDGKRDQENMALETAAPDTATHKSKDVKVTTLPALMESAGVKQIDVLKIDIEGHEHRVLKYFFENAQSSLHPARIIIEHVHDQDGTVDMLTDRFGYRIEDKAARNVLLCQ